MSSDVVFKANITEDELRALIGYLSQAAQPRVEYSKDELDMAKRAVRVAVTNAQAALDMVLKINGGIWEDEMRGWIEAGEE